MNLTLYFTCIWYRTYKLLNLPRYALYFANKGLLDGDIESSIVVNQEINKHKKVIMQQ